MDGNTQIEIYLLMRKDDLVAEFAWDPVAGKVNKGVKTYDVAHAPYGCLDNTGAFRRKSLERWLNDRAIPTLRLDARTRLERVGIVSPTELMSLSYGLGLSDQYWIKPAGASVRWEEVNFFENDFSPLLGELLLPHDQDSLPEVIDELRSTPSLLASSPDAALNGNLPKKWAIEGEARVMLKSGGLPNRFQEPFNERLATLLCERILDEGDYVPYDLRIDGYLKYYSSCPCMVDEGIEFVPAIQLHDSARRGNDEDLGSFYTRLLREHGIDAKTSVEKMLVVDYITANFDRHWNNFGVLMDSDTREFIKCAPIFDTGASFWCDRELSQMGSPGYVMRRRGQCRPFKRDLDAQLRRYCDDLSWLDPDALVGFGEDVERVLRRNPIVASEPGRIEAVRRNVESRIDDVVELKSVLEEGQCPAKRNRGAARCSEGAVLDDAAMKSTSRRIRSGA